MVTTRAASESAECRFDTCSVGPPFSDRFASTVLPPLKALDRQACPFRFAHRFSLALVFGVLLFGTGSHSSAHARDVVAAIWSATFLVKDREGSGPNPLAFGWNRPEYAAGFTYPWSDIISGSETFTDREREFIVGRFHRFSSGAIHSLTFEFQYAVSATLSETDQERWTLHFGSSSTFGFSSRAFGDATDLSGGNRRVFRWDDLESIRAWSDGDEVTMSITAPSNVTVSPTALTLEEGTSGSYTVALDSAPTASVTVEVALVPGADADVTVSPASLTFSTSDWDQPQAVTVTAGQDLDQENDAATVSHTSSGGNYAGVEVPSVTVMVDDNDAPSTMVTLSADPADVAEGVGSSGQPVTVTAFLNAAVRSQATTVRVSVTGLTAATSDFAAVTDFDLTIPPHTASGTATFTLVPVDDAVDEVDETVRITGTTSTAGLTVASPGPVVTIIDDDDQPGVTLSTDALQVPPDVTTTYTVVLDSEPTASVTVKVDVVSGGIHILVLPFSLTFSPMNWDQPQTLTATTKRYAQAGEEARIHHWISGGDYAASSAYLAATVAAPATPSTELALSVNWSGRTEGTVIPIRTMTVTGTLSAAPRAQATEVSLAVVATTASDDDFVVSNLQNPLTIPAHESSGTTTFTLEVLDDEEHEINEILEVRGTTTAANLTVTPAIVTIHDDDEPEITVTIREPRAFTEGAGKVTIPFHVEAVGLRQPNTGLTVIVSTVDGTATSPADYLGITYAELYIQTRYWTPAGDGMTWTGTTPWPVSLTIVDDTVSERSETLTVNTVVSDRFGGPSVAPNQEITILDNDATATAVVLWVDPSEVAEGAGTTEQSVTVTGMLNGAARTQDTVVSVSVAGSGASGVVGFSPVTSFDLTIPAHQFSGTATFQLVPDNDDVDEADETVTVSGTTTDLTVTSAMVTLADDEADLIPPELTAAAVDGAALVLTWDEPLDESAEPATGAFAVTVGSASRGVADVTVAGSAVTLSLAAAVTANDTVTVSYTVPTDPAAARLEDAAGNAAAGFTDQPVTNETPAPVNVPAPEAPESVAAYSIDDQELEVRWSSSDYAATTGFKVQWKSGTEQYDSSRQAAADPATSVVTASSSATSRRYQHVITGLTDGTAYTVRVIATNAGGDSEPSSEATGTPQSEPGQALEFIEDEVVEIHEDSFPWLRDTWDYLTDRSTSVEFREDSVSAVVHFCSPSAFLEIELCAVNSVQIGRSSPTLIHAITHELSHVYTLSNLVVDTPGPLGIAHVYFSKLNVQGTQCSPSELYADMLMILVHGDRAREQSGYWSSCTGTDAKLTEEALAVVRSAASGEMPSWFAATFHDAAGEPDLERLWTDVKAVSNNMARAAIAVQLRDEFGGYCSDRKAAESAFDDGATRNPWADGGCVPQAPGDLTVTAAGAGQLSVSWTAPDDDGGSPIEGYKVQWKSGAEDYDPTRQAEVTDLANLSHVIGDLTDGVAYTVRVLAYNTNGDGAAVAGAAQDTPAVTLELSPSSIGENGGSSTVTARLAPASSAATTVTVAAVAVAPAVAEDFTLSASTTLTIVAGQTESTGTVTVQAVDNDVDAPDKTVRVSGTATNSQGVTGPADVLLTITDDDAPPGAPWEVSYANTVSHLPGDVDRLTAVISWRAAQDGSSIAAWKVQWKAASQAYDDSRQRLISVTPGTLDTTTGSTHTAELFPGEATYEFASDVEYTFRVIATNDSGDSLPSPEVTGTHSPSQYLHARVEGIVDASKTSFPWLGTTLDYLKEYSIPIEHAPTMVTHGVTGYACSPLNTASNCMANGVSRMAFAKLDAPEWVVIHELAHAYTLTNHLVDSPGPLALGAVYFADLMAQAGDPEGCAGVELYADAIMAVTRGTTSDPGYWQRCTGGPVTAAAQTVATSVLSGQIPQAFHDLYNGDDAEPDLKLLWNDVRFRLRSLNLLTWTFQLRDEFGGYCDPEIQTDFEFQWRRDITNPWRDGGCVPGAPSELEVSATDGSALTLTWQAPESDGGSDIDGYEMQWKSGEEDWSNDRTVQVAADTYTHTIPDLTPGTEYTVRVAATNYRGAGTDWAEATAQTPDGAATVSGISLSSTPATAPAYAIGAAIDVQVAFSEAVTVDVANGTPSLGLTVGSVTKQAAYHGGTGTSALTFRYRVAENDSDHDGVSVAAGDIALNGGTIRDESDHDAVLAHPALATQTAHQVDGVRLALTATGGAVANGAVLVLTWDEPLDESSVPAPGAFAVTVGNTPRGVADVTVAGSAVTLTLAAAVTANDTVTVSYTVPTDPAAARLEDAAGNAAAGFNGRAVTNDTPAPVNTPPTGLPVISGTAQVGATLTVSTAGIEDADGLGDATFAYQWLASDGTTETDIQGATAASYTLVAADAGKSIKVQASFTDGGGTLETLTSAATTTVAATVPGAPRGLEVTSPDGREQELEVIWEAPVSDGGSAITRYRVQWKSGSKDYDGTATSTRQALVTDLASLPYPITELTNGVAYTVRVIAVNGVGAGAPSAEVTATPRDDQPAQATIDAEQFCGRSPAVRTAILEAVEGATATCVEADPTAEPPVDGSYETNITTSQLAGISSLRLEPKSGEFSTLARFEPGDSDGLTGLRKMILITQTLLERDGLAHAGVPLDVLGRLRELVYTNSNLYYIESADFFQGLSNLRELNIRTNNMVYELPGNPNRPGKYHGRTFDQPRKLEETAESSQAQDRQQPDPDPATGVLPPSHDARRARHVRHVVRVPSLRVRIAGAPGRDLRGADKSAQARPRL